MEDSKKAEKDNNTKKHSGIDLSKKKWVRNAIIVALGDIVTTYFCFFMALLLRFDFSFSSIEDDYFEWYLYLAPLWCLFIVVVFYFSRLYHSIWSFVSIDEALQVLRAYCLLAPLMVFSSLILKFRMPISFYMIGIVGCIVCHIGNRFAYRILRKLGGTLGSNSNPKDTNEERVMIIGAGDSGSVLIKELKNSHHTNMVPVCVIDDNVNKVGRSLFGVPIVGGRNDIISKAAEYDIDTIIFAIPTASGTNRKAILNIAKETGCKLRTIPGVYQLASGEVSISRVRNVELVDLLGRDPITIDNETVFNMIKGKTVLVTGGGGSIGSELCRQIASHDPKQLIIFDIYENNAYEIQQELLRKYKGKGLNLVTLIGSVRNTHRITSVMQEYKPDIVFHAAAHKHVPLMEESPNEAIKNNVMGTYKTAKAAALAGVKKFVLISTDKAVNPTNIMGATKRICEMIIQMMDHQTENTSYVAVRFGNVLGSNGSVVPLFKKQIAEGGPVTVTHKDINRFFMTIPEAVSLVLQASYYAKGGEIFVLDMGEPVKIDDMARNLIKLSGLRPDIDIKIEYTGLRPGEKLYEEILMDEEGMQKTDNKLIYIGKPIEMDDEWFKEKLAELDRESKSDDKNIREIVQEIVPTYNEGVHYQKTQTAGEKRIPFSPPDISEAEINEVVDAMKSGWITTGPRVKLLERRLAAYIETGKTDYNTEQDSDRWSNRVVCLNSATAAEELNLRILGIGEGDEVIVPAYSYTASASAAIHCGATVKFVDIQKDGDKTTHMPEMDYDALEKAITEKTKAIITVDLGGIICDYDKVFDIVEGKKSMFTPKEKDGTPLGDLSSRIQKAIGRIAVVADGAHSLGGSRVFRGKKTYCGAIADFTSFSFHAVKNFTTAEGGASSWTEKNGIDNAEIYKMYQLLSLHGQNKDALAKTKAGAWEYDIVGPWYKCNMTDIMAAIGLRQLDRYAGLLNRRNEIIRKYDEACDRLGISHLVHHTDNMDSSNHLYLIRIPDISVEKRNELISGLAEQGVSTNVHYKPLPMMSAYKELGWDIKDFPNTFDYYHNLITLPLHTRLTDADVDYILEKFENVLKENII